MTLSHHYALLQDLLERYCGYCRRTGPLAQCPCSDLEAAIGQEVLHR